MWGRRWAREAGGRRRGRNQAGPWRHGEMANVWQAASSGGSGERSKNFLIHQRTHLGLGQAPQWFSLCTCVCVCVGVGVRAPQMQKQLRKLCWQRATPQQQQQQEQRRAASKKSKPNVENVSRVGEEGAGEGRKKNFLLGPLVVDAAVVVLMFFFIGYCRRFCFHVFIAMLRVAKKQNKRVGGRERRQEREEDSNKAKHLNLHNFRSTSQM